MNLLPRDERFFQCFHQQAEILCKASQLLASGLRGGYSGLCDVAKRIEALERSADNIAHAAFEHLRSTFITPFDPEDVQALVSAMDDVVDAVEDAAFRVVAYRVDPIPQAAVELGTMISQACTALGRALDAMEQKRSVMEACIEVNRIEDEADALQRSMLTQIFASGADALTIMKLKDTYEALELATDRCEDVADVIQSIAVKNL